MAGNNRYLRGNKMEIIVPVRGKTAIEAGDFCYFQFGDSYYTYPFSDHRNAGASYAQDLYDYFAGVAMESSPAGTTENISVATAGVFRYPLLVDSAVTVGSVVSACSRPAGSGATNQVVTNNYDNSVHGTSIFLGIIVKTNTSATSFVDFQLRAKAGLSAVAAGDL